MECDVRSILFPFLENLFSDQIITDFYNWLVIINPFATDQVSIKIIKTFSSELRIFEFKIYNQYDLYAILDITKLQYSN